MKNEVALITFARFPSEMAYGIHLVQIANSFVENNYEVNIYYPKTYNSKTIYTNPKDYYGVTNDIEFIEVNNIDITSFRIYDLMPNLIKKTLYSINTFIWAKRVSRNLNEETYLWSTNPNIVLSLKKFFKACFYEKHGEAKFIQKYSLSRLKKDKNVVLVGITKKSVSDMTNSVNKPIYLPLGVNNKIFSPSTTDNKDLTIGYVGLLETHGIDKGVLDACKEIVKINASSPTKTVIVGGPDSKLKEIKSFVDNSNQRDNFEIINFVPHEMVPGIVSSFDIGIVPYPNDKHFNLYASPMKIFELAACGIPVLASNIQGHLELGELNLGIVYFQHDNLEDFKIKLEKLIKDKNLRKNLRNKSLENIDKISFVNRTKKMLASACGSTG
ncbi:MAG: hypothetical protein CMC31_01770 [Flavobacteriaceae bacterium]|nr:hypothetical protein [Flavobacteriaceae bacterium]